MQAELTSTIEIQPAPGAPRAGGWFFCITLTAAAVAVGYGIHIRDGEYWPTAIRFIGGSILLCAAGVALPRVRDEGWGGPLVIATLIATVCFQFFELLTSPPGGWNWWSNDFRNTSRQNFLVFEILVPVALGLILLSVWKSAAGRRWLFPLVLLLHLALGAWMIRSSPGPHIDVYVFQQEGAKALLHGQNPYAISYPDIYSKTGQTDRAVYGEGLSKGGRLGFGFPYPPLSLLLSTAGYAVARDHRYAQLLAMTLAGGLIGYCRAGRVPMLAAAVLLFTPRSFFIIGRGWTEPFVVLALAAVVFVACKAEKNATSRWRCLLPVTLGLFLATKQYCALAIPAILVLLPGPSVWLRCLKVLLPALLIAAAVTAPMALWDTRAYLYSTTTVQKVAPFRDDALSFLVWYAQYAGVRPGPSAIWAAFLVMLPAIGLALWRAPRGPAGFAATVAITFLTFIAFNKQAFANYYYFTLGALCCAVAAMPVSRGNLAELMPPGTAPPA